METSLSDKYGWRLPTALMLTTMVTLGIELLMSRLVSVLFMAGDAYWVIAIALLGFGTGGALMAIFGKWIVESEHLLHWIIRSIGVTALVPVFVFRYARPELQFSASAQNHLFFAVSACCFIPFFLASVFLSTIFMRSRAIIGRLYCFDLLGSGLGCLLFLVLIQTTGVEMALIVLAVISIFASLLLVPRFSIKLSASILLLLAAVIAMAGMMTGVSPMLPFVPRELRMLYDYQKSRVSLDFQKWDPIARIDIASVRDDVLTLPDTVRYKLLTQDGGAPSILLNFDKPFRELQFPDHSLLGIAYWTKQKPKVLIIGPGGGPDVATALRYSPESIDVVELNRTTIHVVGEVFKEFTGNLYQQPEVRVTNDDGRHFIRTSRENYDVIQLTGVDTTVLGSAGALQNLTENYLYTMEAFQDYYTHLTPDGFFSLSYPDFFHWGLRATAMILKLLHHSGIEHPESHLMVSMNGGYVNILLKKTPLTIDEVDTISRHFEQPMQGLLLPLYYHLWGQYLPRDSFPLYDNLEFFKKQEILFDPFHARDTPYTKMMNAWKNQPDSQMFWQGGGGFTPAVDDQPFFFTPIGVGGIFMKRISWLIMASVLFILGPLAIFKKKGLKTRGSLALAAYFACLGLAFIAVEMILLQKFVLFLGHPTYSFAIVLGSLLISTGAGSLISDKRVANPLHGIYVALAGIVLYSLLLITLLNPLANSLLQSPIYVRMSITSLLVIPLGIFMGMMFPCGIRILGDRSEEFVPWAWGINGSASVVGSVLSLFLAIKIGFTALLLLTLCTYLVAGWMAIRSAR